MNLEVAVIFMLMGWFTLQVVHISWFDKILLSLSPFYDLIVYVVAASVNCCMTLGFSPMSVLLQHQSDASICSHIYVYYLKQNVQKVAQKIGFVSRSGQESCLSAMVAASVDIYTVAMMMLRELPLKWLLYSGFEVVIVTNRVMIARAIAAVYKDRLL